MKSKENFEQEIALDVRDEIINIYDDIFNTIWDKIYPTLGTAPVLTIFQRAIHFSSQQFPNLETLTVTEEGIDFREFRSLSVEDDKETIKEGLNELIGNLFEILAKLTGNILVKELVKVVVFPSVDGDCFARLATFGFVNNLLRSPMPSVYG